MKTTTFIITIFLTTLTVSRLASNDYLNSPAKVISPKDSTSLFKIPKDFVIEVVASEPLIHNPVSISFDEKGRLWCVEMRSYMKDFNGTGEDDKTGIISLLEDLNNDGVMDKSTPFIQGLVLPRTVRPVSDGILYIDDTDLWFVENINDKPGKRVLVFKGFCKGYNMEAKSNGLIYGLDNWYYSANCDYRVQRQGNIWKVEKTTKRGQWGISQDDYGRLITNNNSNNFFAEKFPPHLLYRNTNYLKNLPTLRGKNEVYPSRPSTGINRGYRDGMLDKNKKLLKFTAAGGLSSYRGDQYPQNLYNSVWVPEPAAHLVKVNTITWKDSKATTKFLIENDEWLTSTDERSRIVNISTSPDGTLYLVDLYHGMLQHAMHLTDYLKEEMTRRHLDTPTDLGRIYRLKYAPNPLRKENSLINYSPNNLVKLLEHPNSWHREEAQRMIVENKLVSTVTDLKHLLHHNNEATALRALWTLHGLNHLEIKNVLTLLKTKHTHLLATLLRLLPEFTSLPVNLFDHLDYALSDTRHTIQWSIASSLGRYSTSLESVALKKLLEITQHKTVHKEIILTAMSGLYKKEEKVFKQLKNYQHPLFIPLLESLTKQNLTSLKKILINKDNLFQKQAIRIIAQYGIKQRKRPLLNLAFELIPHTTYSKHDWQSLAKSLEKSLGKQRPIVFTKIKDSLQPLFNNPSKDIFKKLFVIGQQENYIRTANDKKSFASGKVQYEMLCMSCHQANGKGLKTVAPPLDTSNWVLGTKSKLIAITLNGVTGPIHVSGKLYKAPDVLPVMPGFRFHPTITDEQLAHTLTYIRNAWSNKSEIVRTHEVSHMRKRLYKNKAPFTESLLLKLDP